jgi:hypothetical protein
VNAAERQLIQRWSPCFNEALNSQPTPVPPTYLPLTAKLRCGQSLNKLIHQAERAVKVEETELWMRETGS